MRYPEHVYRHLPAETIYKLLLQCDLNWKKSQCCKDLQVYFKNLIDEGRMPWITQIICFGLGSIAPDVPTNRMTAVQLNKIERVTYQHAAALTMQSIIREFVGQPVPVMAYDSSYQEGDVEALTRYGITVFDNDENARSPYVAINSETLIFSVGCYPSLQEIVMETSNPAIIIWSRPLTDHFLKSKELQRAYNTLSQKYEQRTDLACFRHAWDPNWLTELVGEKQIKGDCEAMTPKWFTERVFVAAANQDPPTYMGEGPLRRARRLAPAKLWIRKEENDADCDYSVEKDDDFMARLENVPSAGGGTGESP
ncbi:hypothetical protein F5X99DRAFT_143592 [Biscogniauxia marginata]|nr:hypothetical protein F5X99DRAFT_143592 [Biscogniauxia marginata]